MSNLQVVFDVPQNILNGLSSGALERVGGVIRNSATKEIVTWLRDSNVISGLPNLPIPSPLTHILQAAQAGVTLIDGHATAAQVSALTSFMAGGMVLNFAMSAVSLIAMVKRLERLSDEIEQLGTMIKNEFNYDRQLRFRVALEAARDIFEADDTKLGESTARSALDGLFEAREYFLDEFNRVLDGDDSGRLLLAEHYLIRALSAEVSRIRCYATSDSLKRARERLDEAIPLFRDSSIRLVSAWLGTKSALYMHQSVSEDTLNRFAQAKRWLLSPDDVHAIKPEKALFTLLRELRSDFWNGGIIADEYSNLIEQVTRRPSRSLQERVAGLPQQVAHAELVIENYQHLLGYELELRSARLTMNHWQNIVNTEALDQRGFAMVIDTEAATRLAL